MAIELFWGSGSPFSWRVLLTLEVKGLEYQSRLLQFSKREHKTPEYLALNPRGQVPTLRDGDDVICESIAIMAFLDRKYPSPPLFGEKPAETGHIWQAICEQVSYLDGPGDRYILPLYFNRADTEAAAVREAVPLVRAELDRLEARLRDRTWMIGNRISAADIAVFPMIKSVERAAGKPQAQSFELRLQPLTERYPAIARWTSRIEALPGYDRTYPPHWR
jgi:glutathione S-transferase